VNDKNALLEEVYNLNDNQLILLNNHWNKEYSRKTNWMMDYGSLYHIIDGEWGAIYGPNEVNYTPLVLKELDRLNLTSEKN
jgi:hypothetical protein